MMVQLSVVAWCGVECGGGVRCRVVVHAGSSATVPCVAMRRCVPPAARRHALHDRHLARPHTPRCWSVPGETPSSVGLE